MPSQHVVDRGLTFPDETLWAKFPKWSLHVRAGNTAGVAAFLQEIVQREDARSVLENFGLLSYISLEYVLDGLKDQNSVATVMHTIYPAVTRSFPISFDDFWIVALPVLGRSPNPRSVDDEKFSLATIATVMMLCGSDVEAWNHCRAELAKLY